MARTSRVEPLDLARILQHFHPVGCSVELVAADRKAIRQQLAQHLISMLDLDPDTAEIFDSILTSPFYAERVS